MGLPRTKRTVGIQNFPIFTISIFHFASIPTSRNIYGTKEKISKRPKLFFLGIRPFWWDVPPLDLYEVLNGVDAAYNRRQYLNVDVAGFSSSGSSNDRVVLTLWAGGGEQGGQSVLHVVHVNFLETDKSKGLHGYYGMYYVGCGYAFY